MSAEPLRSGIPQLPTEEQIQVAKVSSRLLASFIGEGDSARLKIHDGAQEIEIPMPALRYFVQILAQMAEGNGVTIMPVHAELTTQQAADFLNVSRPYVVGLLERQELPFRKVGTHRRIKLKELVAYHERTQTASKQVLDELTQQAQELGMGY